MSKFNLTAQLSLAPPTNVAQIVRQVNSQLQGIQMNINPNVNAKSLNQANTAVQNVGVSAKVTSKNLNTAAGSANSLGSALGAAARRFASITLATGFFLALTRAVGSAVGRAIEFEKEMLKISQVTGKSIRGLRDLSNEVTNLSTNLGVSSEELLNAARTLSQAGFAADKVTGALKILAQTDLAATFDNIKDTTEGAVAILSQFRTEVRAAGGEVQFLESAMDAINSVSKSFAVESSDLISVVRRTGGVFEAAGGKLNELIALFTSVRATTRETADTIATGFRTIFTRIQRSETIDSLRELGIVLQDTEGKFVGPMEAIARLSAGLQALDPRDFRFNEIVEQLGGFRQIGKVIPLIKQYTTSTAALSIANNSLGSTAADAEIAQQGLGNQFAKLKEQFDATIRTLTSSDTFQTLATTAIKLASSILQVVEALEPLLPMLTALAAFKMGQIALPAFGKFAGVGGVNTGGRIHGFAGGGMVPGRGNRDTVPAMLQPGEFVMRKSAVKKIGANNMADMNNGYAAGGIVTGRRNNYGDAAGFNTTSNVADSANNATGRRAGNAQVNMMVEEQNKFNAAIARSKTDYGLAAGLVPGGFALDTVDQGGKQMGVKSVGSNSSLGTIPLSKMTKADFAKFAQSMVTKYGKGVTISDVEEARKSGITTNATMLASQYPIASMQNESLRSKVDTDMAKVAKKKMKEGVESTISSLKTSALGPTITSMNLSLDKASASRAGETSTKDDIAVSSVKGFLFEAVIDALTGASPAGGTAAFDIPRKSVSSSRGNLTSLFGPTAQKIKMAEIKSKKDKLDQIPSKIKSFIAQSAKVGQTTTGIDIKNVGFARGGRIQGFAEGGEPKGSDTVPAMLTPGEYVVKKSAAQSIGYSNLHRMNQSNGVNGYAAGGIVTGTRGNYGNGVPGGGSSVGTIPGVENVSRGFQQLREQIGKFIAQLLQAGEALTAASTSSAEILQTEVSAGAANIAKALTGAASGIAITDDIMIEAITGALQPLTAGIKVASEGIAVTPKIMTTALTAAFAPLTAGIKTAATGISVTPKMMTTALTGALKPLEGSFKTLGTELKTKLKVFDGLSKPITDLILVMEEFAATLTKQMEAATLLTGPAEALGVSMGKVAEFLYQSATKIAQHLATGANTLGAAMQNAANQMAGGGKGGGVGMAKLAGTMGQLVMHTEAAVKSIGNVALQGQHLHSAMGNLVIAIEEAAVNMGKLAITSATSSTKEAELQAEIDKLKAEMKKMQSSLAKGGAAASGMGAGTGAGAMAAGGKGGGGQMMNQMMMMGMMAGMVTSQMFDMNEETAAYVNTLTMLGPILAMVFVELGNMISGALINTFVTGAESKAKATNVVMTKAESAAKLKSAAISSVTTGIMVGLAVGIALVAARSAKLAAEAKKLGEEYNKAMSEFKKGTGGMSLSEAQSMASGRLQKEAEAAASSFSGYVAMAVTAAAMVGVAIAIFAAGIVTGGAAWVAIGVAMGAAVAAAGEAGSRAGAAFATVEEALTGTTEQLVAATWHAANGMNELAAANKAMELEQLKGLELMKRQGQAFDKLMISSVQATTAMANFKGMEAGMDSEINTEMMDSDAFADIKDGGVEAMREMSKTWFKMAADLATGMNQGVDELIKAGKSADEAMNSTDIQDQLKKYGLSVKMATQMNLMMSGTAKREVKKRMGIGNKSDQDLTSGQRTEVNRREQALIEKMTAEDAKKAQDAQEKSMRERLAAEEKARKMAAEKLAADILLAKQAYQTAQALNSFEVAVVGLQSALSMVDVELGSLTGSIKQYKSVNDKLISTLSSGMVTPEAEEAVLATGRQFGMEAEAEALIQTMKDNEKIRKALIDKGMDEFSGTLEESAANLRFDEFLKDNNLDLSGLAPEIKQDIMNMLEDGLQPGEVEEIMNKINGANEEQIKVLAELAKAQNDYLGAMFKFGNEVVKISEAYAKAIGNVISVQLRGAERLAKAQGRELTTREVRGGEEMKRQAPLRAQGLVGGGVAATQMQIERRRQRQKDLAEKLRTETGAGGGQDPKVISDVQNEQKKLASESKALTENLKKLSDQSKLAAAIMGDIEKEKGKRDTIRGLISEFTFADNQGRKDMDRNFMALQRVMQTGNLNSIPDEMRSAVGGLLTTLEDIVIGPQGQTGGDIKKQLEMQMANQLKIRATGRPLTAEEMQKIFNKTTKEEQLINDLKTLNAEENAAAQALANNQASKMDDLLAGIARLITVLEAAHANAGAAGAEVLNSSQGGVVYAAEGKSIFKPKGTDTVPAMLTPGEFVVNSKASKKHGKTLQAINSGNTNYLQDGGFVTSHKGYQGGYALLPGQIDADQKFIRDSTMASVWDSLQQTKGVSVGDQPESIRGTKQISEDIGWTMGSKWDTFNFMKMWPMKAEAGELKRGALNKQTTGPAVKAWRDLATYNQTAPGPRGGGGSQQRLYHQPPASSPTNLAGMGQIILAHQHFSNLMFPRGGTVGNNKNSNAYKFWQEGASIRGGAQWLLTNQDEDDVDGTDDSWAGMGMFFAGDIRKWYQDRGRDGLWNLNAANATEVLNSRERLSNAYRQYETATSSTKNAHHQDMIDKSNRAPYVTGRASEGDRIVPNPKRANAAMKNPGRAQLNWLTKFSGADPYVGASDDHYGFLASMDGMIPISDEKDRMNANAKRMLESVTSHYGQYIQDKIFNNAPLIASLARFYKDPSAVGNHKFISDTLGEASFAGFEAGEGKEMRHRQGQLLKNMIKFPAWIADNTELDGNSGPALGSEQSNAALGALGWIPWNPPGIVDADLENALWEDIPRARGIFDKAKTMTDGWGGKFNDSLKDMEGQGAVNFTSQSITGLLKLIEGGGGNDTAGVGLANVVAEKVKEEEAEQKAIKDAKDAAANAVVKQIKSPFLSDAGKQNAMDQAFGMFNEAARADPLRASRIRMIHRIPDYAGALDPARADVEPKSVGQLAPTSRNFNALFPYFDALGKQVFGMIREGAITGAGEDGISIDPTALSRGVKSLEPLVPGGPPRLSVPDSTKKVLKQFSAWSNTMPVNWTGKEISKDEMMLMHKFFGMGNIMKTNANMQTDTRIALTKLAMEDFNGYTGYDILKASLPLEDIDHLAPGMDVAGNLAQLEEFKESLKPQKKASGGPIGSIDWSPKGTDTVPAMLTPGEFVMRKSAVDKYGMGFMSAINEGRGGSGGYMHDGGVAAGGASALGGPPDLRIDRVLSSVTKTSKIVNSMAGEMNSLQTISNNQSSLLTGFETMSETDTAFAEQVNMGFFAMADLLDTAIKGIDYAGLPHVSQAAAAEDPMDNGTFRQTILDFISAQGAKGGQGGNQSLTLPQFIEQKIDLQSRRNKLNFTMLAGTLPNRLLKGGFPAFMATGGMARGTDTVPAMLTPGEFVMKKSTVDKYGVGFMRSLNNGASPTSRSRGVQYLQDGGSAVGGGGGLFAGVGDIVSSISDSLSAFTQAFSLFSGLSNLLSNTINSMAEMNITHTININGSVNIPGFSKRAVKKIINAVVEEVVDDVDAKINQALAERDRNNENRT